MTLPTNNKAMERFIHEIFHEIAKDKELNETITDLVSIIITKWEKYSKEYIKR